MNSTGSISNNVTVLLVDDDDGFRSFIADQLRNGGFNVLDTRSTSQACEWLKAGEADIVLLDWDLRKGKAPNEAPTGSEILRASRESNPLLPVIVMSGAHDLDARCDSMMVGADSFISKPFPMSLLSEHLSRWTTHIQAHQNPFSQLAAGLIQTAESVNRAYARAVVERIGSALHAAPKLGLSRQTVASYLADAAASR